MKYLIYQGEKCPTTGREHWQLYVEFGRPVSRTIAQELLQQPGCHLEARRGTKNQAREYCRKTESRVIPPQEFGEVRDAGEPRRNKDSEIREVIDELKRGHSVLDMEDEIVAKHYKMIEYMSKRELEKLARFRTRSIRVLVLWGDTGVGKTHFVFSRVPMEQVYVAGKKNTGVWWDGYTGERTLLLDDFYSWIPFHDFLRMLDKYPVQLDVKGTTAWANWTTVVITSNESPEDWYPNIGGAKRAAMVRRLHKIVHVTEHIGDNSPLATELVSFCNHEPEALPAVTAAQEQGNCLGNTAAAVVPVPHTPPDSPHPATLNGLWSSQTSVGDMLGDFFL